MTLDHRQLGWPRLAIVAAALVAGAPAAHAFTMETIANSNGKTTYVDSGDRLEDAAKNRTTPTPGSNGGLQFSVGPSDRFGPSSRVGQPIDQSRFNDR
jgi:hypothetical protein